MKFFTPSVIAFSLLSLVSASAIPVDRSAAVAVSLDKRAADIPTAYGIVEELFAKVKTYTGQINATSSTISPESNPVEVLAAGTEINTVLLELTTLIVEYTGKFGSAAKRDIVSRQTAPDLAGLITNLLLEISGALNGVINAIGLGGLLSGTLGGLVTALSGLLLALVPVVDNLLELVRRLLDGLLIGLSAALVGLII